MKVLWLNSTLSGLCDRFIDLSLVATLCKLMKADLTVLWRTNSNFTEFQLKTWKKARFDDYKYELFSEYYTVPSNVRVINEEELSRINFSDYVIFNDYVGGVLHPQEFHKKYLSNVCSSEDFLEAYRQVVGEFRPTQKLLDLVKLDGKIDVAIHLRRGDKVSDNPDSLGVSSASLLDLDTMTKSCVDRIVSKLNDPTIFICSDDSRSIKDYEERYSKTGCNLFKVSDNITEIERTYVDLFLMTQSDVIVMSQNHTNFSLFASHVSGKKLIYFFKENRMISGNKSVNAIFHEDVG